MVKRDPTDPLTKLELHNPLHEVPELHKILRYPDLGALKLGKGQSGSSSEKCAILRTDPFAISDL